MSKVKFLAASLAAVGLVAVCLVAPFSHGDTESSASEPSVHHHKPHSQHGRVNLRTMGVPAVSVDQCSAGDRPSPLCGSDYDCGPFGRCENGGCACSEGWCLDYSRHCTLPANADGSCPSPNDNKGCDMFYRNVNGVCEDIDECSLGITNCAQHCINSQGGFYCGCDEGYTVGWYGWQSSCDDVDECATDNGGCAQTCTNTDGSFTCGCNAGFALNADGQTCDDVDECAVNNGGCAQTCTNTDGSFSCGCNAGFSLGADGVSCEAATTVPVSSGCRVHIDASAPSRDVQCYPGSVTTVRQPSFDPATAVTTSRGKPVIRMGGNVHFGRVEIANSDRSGMTAAVVVAPNQSFRSYHNIFDHLRGGVNHGPMLWVKGGNVFEFNTGSGVNVAFNPNYFQVWMFTFNAGGTERAYRDGNPNPVQTRTGVPPLVSTYNLDLFNRGGGQRFRGDVGEIIYWDRELDTQERTDVFDHLMAKWQ